ncbi:Tellurite resistance protein TehA [Cetobacterium ceti]|uniref:Tellurite resistance protein TehA n=1 Tax=Cetobacterium ceti TaxID=180163 RepID=A0A1T4PNS8_9FUSO|nr:TDT family transporter [Cetobacterium ceti]SJZ92857.1 Tellurite resistance protein TehA [Cetobacterium ceti]
MNRVIGKFKDMPVALTGLALGIGGVSGALGMFLGNIPLYIGVTIATILISIIIIKNFFHFKQFLEELKHPTLGSFIPTLDMALMVIAGFVVKYFHGLGESIWLFAIVLHVIFCALFFYYRFKNFKIHHMIPSWFVPPIGIVVACVSGKAMGHAILGQWLFYFGFISYGVLLPIMMYRVMFVDQIDDNRLPTFAIMAAPPSLCLAGYLTIFPNPSTWIINILLALSLFMTSWVYISFIRICRIPFNPSYASFTFPLAIGATAILKYSNFVAPISPEDALLWKYLGTGLATVAALVITTILVKMTKYVYAYIIKN